MKSPRLIFEHQDMFGSIEIWSDTRYRLRGIYAILAVGLPLMLGIACSLSAQFSSRSELEMIAVGSFAFVVMLLLDWSRK